MFSRDSCKFRFATHLFTTELSKMQDENIQAGRKLRISANSNCNGTMNDTTFTQDFCMQLDGLLRTLVQTEPQFIRCLAPSYSGLLQDFDRSLVSQQLKTLQIIETVHIMSGGFSYRAKFHQFYQRYRCLMIDQGDPLDMRTALVHLGQTLQTIYESVRPHFGRQISVCERHVMMSEHGRQFLEQLRAGKRNNAARAIQSWWRTAAATAKARLETSKTELKQLDGVDVDMLKLTCQFLGKDWVRIIHQTNHI